MDENLCIKSMNIDFSHIWNELDGKENYYLTLLVLLLLIPIIVVQYMGFNSGVNEHFSVSFHHEESHKQFLVALQVPDVGLWKGTSFFWKIQSMELRKDHMVI